MIGLPKLLQNPPDKGISKKQLIKYIKYNNTPAIELKNYPCHTQWRIQKILVGGMIKILSTNTHKAQKFKGFFRPNSGGLKKKNQVVSKKKKVFTEIESDFSAEIGNSKVFSAQNQVVSKKKV